MRRWLFGVLAVLVFVTANALIAHKERVLKSGQRMRLRLAPADPRSLMQGDYMVLRYEMANAVNRDRVPPDGRLVVELDDDDAARFVRVYAREPLGPREHLLRYRVRQGQLRVGAESFFFQEGHADRYARARYGELRVTSDGTAVLAGLADERFNSLGR